MFHQEFESETSIIYACDFMWNLKCHYVLRRLKVSALYLSVSATYL